MHATATANHGRGHAGLWIALLPLALFSALAWGLLHVELPWRVDLAWIPALGVSFAFRVDGLSAQMLALITGIGTLVFVYASGYLAGEARRGRLLGVLLLFMLAMIGAVTADNLIVLFLFWELTSLTSFLLVGYKHDDAHARAAARQALLVTMGGGLALLGGFVLLARSAGTWSLSGVLAAGPALLNDPLLAPAVVLVMIGAFTKSAQFPFHFWLPNAMSAPTPVSAYLHSATMVKLGIYLLARFDASFDDLPLWESTLTLVGTITAVWGAVLALRERDLKRILARTTVSALGTLTLLIGLSTPGAGLAVAAFLFAHALYKAPLFMVAGNIDHATGTRSIDHLMGLRRAMPWTAAVAILAGLSMAGLPLSFGFVAKDVMAIAKAEAELFTLASYALVLVNAIAVAVAGVAAIRVFWGPPEFPRGRIHEVHWTMLVPPLLIVLLGLEFEFIPNVANPLLLAAAQSISPTLGEVNLQASYDLATLLSTSGIAAAIGVLLFLAWDRLHDVLHRQRWLDRYGPAALYEALLHGLARVAAWHTRAIQHGRLTGYLRLTLAALLAMGTFAWLLADPAIRLDAQWAPQGWAWLAACVLMVTGAVAAVSLRDRLALLMASGLIGYGSAVLFLFAGAPDLAVTQFMVETVLVVVAASLLPQFADTTSTPRRWRAADVTIAIAAGLGCFVLLTQLAGQPADTQLADWFAANSLPEGRGRNVVNVIIVDFRALDTLGEIAVVAFSLLAALPLLAGLRKEQRP
ncbi:MAG: DUF4040 domain-containing protein [Luteimonas sp.]|nr:DUF4040 domain-containing protein [Luteimonas sp.]